MAQTGNFSPIQLYSSSTPGNAPAVGNLVNSTLGSELAINIADGKLFYKDSANAIQVIAWKTTPTTAGGTGLTSYTAGDMVYWASGTTFTKLGIGTPYYQLGVNSAGTAPAWQPSAVSTLTAQGDLLYASGANTLARLAKNTTATRYLSNTGTSNNPAWAQIDLSNGVTGILASGNLPVGSILQVVSATTSTAVSSTSTSFADTGLTATITPTKSTSKILVIVNQNNLYKTGVSLYNAVSVRLLRGATNISSFAINVGYTGTATDNIVSAGANYIDSPATTSATTYKTQFAANVAGQTVEVQNGSAMSTITLLEIAA